MTDCLFAYAMEPSFYDSCVILESLYFHRHSLHSPTRRGNMAVTSGAEAATNKQVAGWLSSEEFRVLEAVCDTLLPVLEPPQESSDAVAAYYRRRANDLDVARLVAETLALENAQSQEKFRQLLGLMTSPTM